MSARISDVPRISDVQGDIHLRAIRLWLYVVAALVLAMVLVGGATRLTESGLSITEWRPVMGALPPMSAAQWQAEFEKYQAIPQYRALNAGMGLDAFKTIYWWEWAHRLIGRLIGVAFLLPFLWLLWRGWVGPALRARLWFIFALGALQGVVGWWMVASGLADRVEVSQYRLATHLALACAIYVALLWTAQRLGEPAAFRPPHAAKGPLIFPPPLAGEGSLIFPPPLAGEGSLIFPPSLAGEGRVGGRIRAGAIGLFILVLAEIYLGALVAGLRAGVVYNTWPLIDGALAPDPSRLFLDTPLWRNFFENKLTVQFDHRMLADAILICALLHVLDVARMVKKGPALAGAVVLFAAVAVQAALGIATLLLRTPISLALMHQAMAMLVLTAATAHAALVTGRRRAREVVPLAPA